MVDRCAAGSLAIERSLLPVFAILASLAVVNLFVTNRFPDAASEPEEEARVELG